LWYETANRNLKSKIKMKMKTIEIPAEMHDQLVELATEYMTQDNRATATPYLFQVQETVEVAAYSGCGEEVWCDDEGGTFDDEAADEYLKQYILDNELDLVFDEMADWEKEQWFEKDGWRKINQTTEHRYSNAFFTGKGCQEHIRINGHNLNKPVDYLNVAFRNAEFDLVSSLFKHLYNQKNSN